MKKHFLFLSVVITTLLQLPLSAQNYLTEPYSFTHKLKKAIKTIDAPFTEYERNEPSEYYIPPARPGERGEISLNWASGKIINWDLKTLCKAERVKGGKIWRLKIKSEKAKGIGIDLVTDMPAGSGLFIYDPAQKQVFPKVMSHGRVSYYIQDADPKIIQGLSVEQIRSDEIIIEYFEPKKSKKNGRVIIKQISHQYIEFGIGYNNEQNGELRSSYMACGTQTCSKSVACACSLCSFLPAIVHEDTLARSVLKVHFFTPKPLYSNYPAVNNNHDGTGVLINHNDNNKTYLLTAYHNLRTHADGNVHIPIDSIVYAHYYFKYQKTNCNSPFTEDTTLKIKNASAKLVALNKASDMALLELLFPIKPTWEVFYAGWNSSKMFSNQGLGIHHPMGEDKRISIQNDSGATFADPNGGIKPYNYWSASSSVDFQHQLPTNVNGNHFAVTYEQGSTDGGSSGSPYFDENGYVRGQFHGGPACCIDSLSNNGKINEYGRLWYSWNTAWDIDSSSTISSFEQQHTTLLPWLDPLNLETDSLKEGFAMNNCDIYMKDCTADTGTEPSACLSPIISTSIVASPDLWNNRINILDQLDAIGNTHEMPDFMDINGNHLDNYLSFNVQNPNSCTSAPATLHLYWAMASTGLNWPNSWNNHNVGTSGNTCIAGNEIGADCYANEIRPYQVPSLSPGQVFRDDICWLPPNFTDQNADSLYYPFQDPIFCANLQAAPSPNILTKRFAISLLARLVSLDNPISNEQTGSIMANVRNNNNITLRNTFLADIGAPPQVIWTGGNIGGPISLVFQNIRGLIAGGELQALQGLLNIELLPSTSLWDKWASTGFKGEGIEIVSDGIVKITNFEMAKLTDIPFETDKGEAIAIRATINSTGKMPNNINIPNNFTFAISHEPTNPQGNEPESSPCVFEVNDIWQHLPRNISDFATIKLQPNPFNTETQIIFDLYQSGNINLQIYDMQGRLAKSIYENKLFEQGNYSYTLSESSLNSGLYIVVLQTAEGTKSEKLIKIK